MEVLTAGLAVVVLYLFVSLRIIRQYERAVTFFLGRFWGTKRPGLIHSRYLRARQADLAPDRGGEIGAWRRCVPSALRVCFCYPLVILALSNPT